MTHLYIKLDKNIQEHVDGAIIAKLYELTTSGNLDLTSDLIGNIKTNNAYRAHVEYLRAHYPDLTIDADTYAILFEDPAMLSYLLSIGVGSNGIISEVDAAAATVVANSVNTNVTKFNELKYFTNITQSKGGFYGGSGGAIRFYGWKALLEIDISNFTSIGHPSGYGWEDTFRGCTSLKKVTASSNLGALGNMAFDGCSNLEDIIGLSGNILIYNSVFSGCKKLKLSNFDNVTFSFVTEGGNYAFKECELLTSITLTQDPINVPLDCFYKDSALTQVSGLNNVTSIGKESFLGCSSLTTIDVDWSKVTTIESNAFSRCASLVINDLAMPNLTSISDGVFRNTKVKVISNMGSITTARGLNEAPSLTSVTLPSTVTKIGSSCCYYSRALANINMPSSLKYIEYRGLTGTAITSIVLPEGFLCSGEAAFAENNNLTSLTFPSTLTQQWENGSYQTSKNTGLRILDILAGTGLQTVILPSNIDIELLYIGNSKNASFTVPDSVIYISALIKDGSTGIITFGNNSNVKYMGQNECYNKITAFDFTTTHTIEEWDQLEHNSNNNVYENLFQKAFANFPKNNFKYIPCYFLRNNVSRNDIPDIIGDNVIGIGREAFAVYNYTRLSYSITLPSTLLYLGKASFGRIRPTAFIFKSTTPPLVNCTTYADEIFYGYYDNYNLTDIDNAFSTIPIYVPSTAVAAYRAAFPRMASYIQANPNP